MSLQNERAQAREIERLKAELAAEQKRADAAVADLAKIYQIALRAHEDSVDYDVIELSWDVMCYVPAEARGAQEVAG